MAVTQTVTDDRTKRTDLPARAAKRIGDLLFPPTAALSSELTTLYRARLEKEITRAIWEEMIAIEGEISIGLKGVPE
jgi:hypothetical protein